MKILIFLIPLLPLLVSTSLVFPYITGKNFAFRIIVGLAAALWISLAVINKEYRPHTSVITISILTFTFIVGLADLLGINPYKSFWSNYERMEGYITILHLALYFLILKSVLRTKRDWKIFFSLVLLTSVLVALFSFVFPLNDDTLSVKRHVMEYGTRAYSTIGNPPFLAAYLLLSTIVGLILIINEKKYYLRFAIVAAVILNSAGIYLTATRGVILGGMAGIIALYILGIKKLDRKSIIKIVAIVIFLAFACVSIVFFVINNNGVLDQYSMVYRFKTMFSDSSVLTRLDVWGMALTAIKERPLLGWGQENFIAIYTVNPIPLVLENIWLDRAHNIVIDWLVNAGFLGLFSYLAIFVSAVYVTKRAHSMQRISIMEGAVIISALAAYFIQNLSLFDTVNSYMIFFALLAYIDTLGFIDKPLSEQQESSMNTAKTRATHVSAIFISLMLFSVTCYYLNYKPMEQGRQIVKIGVSSSENNSYSLLLDDFNHALSMNTFGEEFLRESMLSISNTIIRMKVFDREGALRFIEATLWALEKGIALNRHNLEYLTNVILFFNKVAVYEKSYIARTEALINECKDLNPEYQWLDMIMADVLILKQDYEGAFEIMKNSVDINEGNDTKQIKLAMAAILASKDDVVEIALGNVKEIRAARNSNISSGMESVFSFDELNKFVQHYKTMKDYQKAIYYLREIIGILADKDKMSNISLLYHGPVFKAKYHFEVAETYMKAGDRENAILEAKKAAALDPLNFSEKTKGIIAENQGVTR